MLKLPKLRGMVDVPSWGCGGVRLKNRCWGCCGGLGVNLSVFVDLGGGSIAGTLLILTIAVVTLSNTNLRRVGFNVVRVIPNTIVATI